MPYHAHTTCDDGLGEFVEVSAIGETADEALEKLGSALHEFMFQEKVTEDYASGLDFIQDCRNYFPADVNAVTSTAIWTALQDAVNRIQCNAQ